MGMQYVQVKVACVSLYFIFAVIINETMLYQHTRLEDENSTYTFQILHTVMIKKIICKIHISFLLSWFVTLQWPHL